MLAVLVGICVCTLCLADLLGVFLAGVRLRHFKYPHLERYSCVPGRDARESLSSAAARMFNAIHAFLDGAGFFDSNSGANVYSCIPGQDARGSWSPPATYMCIPAPPDETRGSF